MTGLRRLTKEEGGTGSAAQVWEVGRAMWVQTFFVEMKISICSMKGRIVLPAESLG